VKPRSRRHAQIHLPPLTAEQAYHLVRILQRAESAIWRAHGDEMADLQGRDRPEEPPPSDAVDVVDCTREDDFAF
jgi:hypothetical protein